MRLLALAAALMISTAVQAAPVTITYWSMWNETEPSGAVTKAAIEEFQKANPDITVKVNWAGRDVRKILLPAIASGEAIDIVENGNDWLMRGDNYQNWLPIENYLDKAGPDGSPALRASLLAALVQQYSKDEHNYVVPTQPFAVLYFYSQAQFDKAGITATPKTWADLMATGKALRAAGFDPITIDEDAYTDVNFAYHALRATGDCKAVRDLISDKTGQAWGQDVVKSMAQDIVDARAADLFSPNLASNRYPAGETDVALGVASMNLNGSWLPGEVSAAAGPDFKWGAFAYPTVTAGLGGNDQTMMGAQGFAISKLSAHPDEAFALISYILSKPVQERFVAEANATSSRTDVDWPADIRAAQDAVRNTKEAIGWACDIGEVGEVVQNVVLPGFKDLLNGAVDAEGYVKAMTEQSAQFWSTH